MAYTLDKIEVRSAYKHLNIREIKENGRFHRRILTPDKDVSGEVQEIQDKAEELWTDEVKSAWAANQAEVDAREPG